MRSSVKCIYDVKVVYISGSFDYGCHNLCQNGIRYSGNGGDYRPSGTYRGAKGCEYTPTYGTWKQTCWLLIGRATQSRLQVINLSKKTMIPDPRTAIIPKNLLENLGAARAIVWKVLPLSDDGSTMILYCPNDGDYGSRFASLFGRELGRKIEFIPVDRSQLMQAIEEQFATIQDCPPRFSFLCPKTWQSLESTDTEEIRFCPTCQKNVHWCKTPEEVEAYGEKGRCIAVSSVTYSSPSFPVEKMLLGLFEPKSSKRGNRAHL